MGWLSLLLGLATPLSQLLKSIEDAKTARANAQTEQERIAADERVKSLEARRDVMMAQPQQASVIDAVVRLLYALPPAIYFAKLFVWDKALGWGTTDALGPDMQTVAWVVIGFYFLHQLVRR